MKATKSVSGPTFGFLCIADLGSAAWIGGYLLLNALGRPLEFHCSETVRTNRAQQILFGDSLKPFLFGEQIGRALVENSQLTPEVIFGDCWHVLALRSSVSQPVVGVVTKSGLPLPPSCLPFFVGDNSFYVASGYETDRDQVIATCKSVLAGWDLREPFQRIQEAVTELQKVA